MITAAVRRPGRLILSLVFAAACLVCADPASSMAQGLVDPACPGGTGTVISVPQSWLAGAAFVVSEMLPGGITLVVASAGYPTASFAVADAFTSDCSPDRAFGSRGVERLVLGGQAFSIAAAVPAPSGGTILAGSTAKGWLVARLDARGHLDPTFGSGGWTVVSWPGSVSAIAVTPSGDIVLGGSQGGGCCVREWVGELNAGGGVISQFGSGGRTPVPVYGDDSGITRIWVEPDGDIFALTSGGNMGCWGISISALTSSGSPVPSFRSNFTAAMRRVSPSGIFVGDVIARSTDFLLLGTEQSTCVTSLSSRTAQGRVAAFQLNGKLEPRFAANGVASFNSPMAQPVWALARNNGGFVMAAAPVSIQFNPHVRADLSFFDFSADGRIGRAFGKDGVADVRLPYLSQSLPASAVPIALATNGEMSALVTSTASGRALRLIQLPY
ncbi:MAG: hypothetical protein ACRDOU_07540 [Streptosporangiaceae bacterium]